MIRTVRLKVPGLHPGQQTVVAERRRFNVLDCGRRWGKTVIGMDRVVEPVVSGKKWAWFAPTYKLLLDPWRVLLETLAPVVKRRDLVNHRLEFHGGGVLECWSLTDPDAGRGRAYHGMIIDEAALVRSLQDVFQKSLRPMLSDYRGEAWFLSTPAGVVNDFHALYQRGQDMSQENWASWQRPTRTNPYIDAAEIEDARKDLTDLAFAQEYEAQFVTWAGAVFRRISEAVGAIELEPATMIGVDWGRVGDYTVFVALSAKGHVVAIDRFRGLEFALQRARLTEFWKANGGRCWILAEINHMGWPVVEQLAADGLPMVPFQTTGPSKAQIIEQLTLAFERGMIRIPNNPVLVGELQAFASKRTPSGLSKYGAPEGQHDDTVMALAFAWHGHVAPRAEQRYWDAGSGGMSATPSPYTISPV